MPVELWLAYAVTVCLLVMVPGPVVGVVVAIAGAAGRRPALAMTAGASVSIALQLSAAALGLASILALAGHAFEVLRWVCAAYLVYMAVRLWRAPVETDSADATARPVSDRAGFVQGFLVSSTNPKSLVFFAAFFPQFIDPARPVWLQLLILTVTFQAVFTAGVTTYAIAAARLGRFAGRPGLARVRNRVLASFLAAGGVGLAVLRR
ncbi:MAG: LysE family transporter [Azospirillaceae bacterium]